jgi:hypothetical protein
MRQVLAGVLLLSLVVILTGSASAPVAPVWQQSALQRNFDWRDPESYFDATRNTLNRSNITWTPVANLQATCESESRRRGNKGFGYPLQACSFWVGNQCDIFTNLRANMHTVGHEVLHCFQGNFHP